MQSCWWLIYNFLYLISSVRLWCQTNICSKQPNPTNPTKQQSHLEKKYPKSKSWNVCSESWWLKFYRTDSGSSARGQRTFTLLHMQLSHTSRQNKHCWAAAPHQHPRIGKPISPWSPSCTASQQDSCTQRQHFGQSPFKSFIKLQLITT